MQVVDTNDIQDLTCSCVATQKTEIVSLGDFVMVHIGYQYELTPDSGKVIISKSAKFIDSTSKSLTLIGFIFHQNDHYICCTLTYHDDKYLWVECDDTKGIKAYHDYVHYIEKIDSARDIRPSLLIYGGIHENAPFLESFWTDITNVKLRTKRKWSHIVEVLPDSIIKYDPARFRVEFRESRFREFTEVSRHYNNNAFNSNNIHSYYITSMLQIESIQLETIRFLLTKKGLSGDNKLLMTKYSMNINEKEIMRLLEIPHDADKTKTGWYP